MLIKLEEKILQRFIKKQDYYQKPILERGWDVQRELSTLIEVFPGFFGLVKGKSILDFGCGCGHQSAALAMSGAKCVLGVDINPRSLIRANKLIRDLKLEANVEFCNKIEEDVRETFDIVISQNSMEHFSDPIEILKIMKSALAPEGKLFITFGPPWFAPNGSHMNYFLKIPWVNILFSERSIMNVRKQFRDDGAMRYEDVESGLNKMSVRKFERIIKECGMEIRYKKYDCVKKMNFFGNIPLFRELFVNRISCILTKNKL